MRDSGQAAIRAGVPAAPLRPPAPPPPGPMSTTQPAARMTSRSCSITTTVAPVGLHGELAVHAGDDHRAVRWLERAVDDEEVPVLDAGAGHRVALRADEVGRGRPRDQQLVEVERALDILLGGRREPRHDRRGHERRPRGWRRLHGRDGPCRPFPLAFHVMTAGCSITCVPPWKRIISPPPFRDIRQGVASAPPCPFRGDPRSLRPVP